MQCRCGRHPGALDALLAYPGIGGASPVTDVVVARAASAFGTSREVVWRRLLTLGRISPSVYRQKRAELQRFVRKLRSTDGGPSPAVLAVSDLGRPFVRLVVAGYHQDILTGSDVAEYLGVRWKHIAKIEAAVREAPS